MAVLVKLNFGDAIEFELETKSTSRLELTVIKVLVPLVENNDDTQASVNRRIFESNLVGWSTKEQRKIRAKYTKCHRHR